MEHNSSFDSFELQFTPVAQGFFRETAKWAKFLSIVGFVLIGFMVIGAFAMFAMGGAGSMDEMDGMNSMGGGMGMMGAMGAALGVVYLLVALLYFFPVLYLYKFASKAKQALDGNNTEELTSAFENLKSHYKFVGILTAIVLIIYALFFILAIVAGIGAAAAM